VLHLAVDSQRWRTSSPWRAWERPRSLWVLGLGLMFSIFDRGIMTHFKDGLLRIIGGSAIVGGAGVAASFITSNFKL
jgi:hypothetical protein